MLMCNIQYIHSQVLCINVTLNSIVLYMITILYCIFTFLWSYSWFQDICGSSLFLCKLQRKTFQILLLALIFMLLKILWIVIFTWATWNSCQSHISILEKCVGVNRMCHKLFNTCRCTVNIRRLSLKFWCIVSYTNYNLKSKCQCITKTKEFQ